MVLDRIITNLHILLILKQSEKSKVKFIKFLNQKKNNFISW